MIPKIRNNHGEALDTTLQAGKRKGYLVILAHGLTGNKNRPVIANLADALALDGWPCLRVSYSGNGMSEGSFSDSNITKNIADLTSIIDQLSNGRKIIYIGHSMGSAAGTLTAVRDERICGLISLAGLVHTQEFAERTFAKLTPGQSHLSPQRDSLLSQSLINDLTQISSTLPAVKELRLPWLLFHGLKDNEVYPRDSEDLCALIAGKID